ncbi:bacteriocin-type signal sequence [Staphylococcus epidermidis]|jgi:bacteriocin-like protein|nr:bacteriocin-type signal sequence [Staphylococcus epidermidis]WFD53481.1 bacteriocin-type signal sequence [Staphylococcus epidermidis]
METLNEKQLKDINGGRETGCSGDFVEDGIMCNIGQGIGKAINKVRGKII